MAEEEEEEKEEKENKAHTKTARAFAVKNELKIKNRHWKQPFFTQSWKICIKRLSWNSTTCYLVVAFQDEMLWFPNVINCYAFWKDCKGSKYIFQ